MGHIGNKNAVGNNGGRPTKLEPGFLPIISKLCEIGMIVSEIADVLCVTEATVYSWKKNKPEFLEAVKKGQAVADQKVEQSLYHRACGYSHDEVKFAQHEGVFTDERTVKKHYPPDTGAAMNWLKNRKPDEWRDKKEVELSGEVTMSSLLKDNDQGGLPGLPEKK